MGRPGGRSPRTAETERLAGATVAALSRRSCVYVTSGTRGNPSQRLRAYSGAVGNVFMTSFKVNAGAISQRISYASTWERSSPRRSPGLAALAWRSPTTHTGPCPAMSGDRARSYQRSRCAHAICLACRLDGSSTLTASVSQEAQVGGPGELSDVREEQRCRHPIGVNHYPPQMARPPRICLTRGRASRLGQGSRHV